MISKNDYNFLVDTNGKIYQFKFKWSTDRRDGANPPAKQTETWLCNAKVAQRRKCTKNRQQILPCQQSSKTKYYINKKVNKN